MPLGGRIGNLIGIIGKLGPILDRLGDIDWSKITPILEQIIGVISNLVGAPGATNVEATALSAETLATAQGALTANEQAELTAQGLDLASIVQLVQLIVSLIRAIRGGNAGA